MQANEECLSATNSATAPWYVIPADDKKNARLIVSQIVLDLFDELVMACCGDVPTLETLTAVSILRNHLPELKIRVINIVDLMKLQPESEHPHGLSDQDSDALFTKDT